MKRFLEEFTSELLQTAKECWISQAAKLDMPTVDVERLFDWSVNRIDYAKNNNDSHAYGVFDELTNSCLAVVDIIHSNNNPQKKFVKMLTVDLCPELSKVLINEEDMSKIDGVIDVYARATTGTLVLTLQHNAAIIKLYGRDEPMRLLLSVLKERINSSSEIFASAYWEGLWLTVAPAKKG